MVGKRTAALTVSIGFLLGACSGSDDASTTADDTSSPSLEVSTPPSDAPETVPTTVEPTTTVPPTTVAPTTTAPPEPPANPAPQPKPKAQAPSGNTGSQAQQVINLTNAERAKNGCPSVTANSQLNQASKAHSQDMVRNNYFSHTGRDGSSPSDRARRFGYNGGAGENIANGYPTPAAVVQGWMNSPGHRANILNCRYTKIGVGVEGAMWTQMFGF